MMGIHPEKAPNKFITAQVTTTRDHGEKVALLNMRGAVTPNPKVMGPAPLETVLMHLNANELDELIDQLEAIHSELMNACKRDSEFADEITIKVDGSIL